MDKIGPKQYFASECDSKTLYKLLQEYKIFRETGEFPETAKVREVIVRFNLPDETGYLLSLCKEAAFYAAIKWCSTTEEKEKE